MIEWLTYPICRTHSSCCLFLFFLCLNWIETRMINGDSAFDGVPTVGLKSSRVQLNFVRILAASRRLLHCFSLWFLTVDSTPPPAPLPHADNNFNVLHTSRIKYTVCMYAWLSKYENKNNFPSSSFFICYSFCSWSVISMTPTQLPASCWIIFFITSLWNAYFQKGPGMCRCQNIGRHHHKGEYTLLCIAISNWFRDRFLNIYHSF